MNVLPEVEMKEEPLEFFNEFNCNEDEFNYDSKVLPTLSGTWEVFGDKSLRIKDEDYKIIIEGNSEEDYIRMKNVDIKGANCVNHEDHESIEEFDVKFEDITVKDEDIEETNLVNYEDQGSIEEFEVKDIIHNHNSYINSEIREVVQRKLIFENNKMAGNGSAIDRGKTTSWPFYISQSKVPKGGMGVWTNTHLPKGLLFGPFEGRICQNVEPGEESISNWLGYVNFSRSCNKTNLIAFQYKGEIYYKTKMDIKKETELKVWYGGVYRKHLRYILENKSNGKILRSSKEIKTYPSKRKTTRSSANIDVEESCMELETDSNKNLSVDMIGLFTAGLSFSEADFADAETKQVNPPQEESITAKKDDVNPPQVESITAKKDDVNPPQEESITAKKDDVNPPQDESITAKEDNDVLFDDPANLGNSETPLKKNNPKRLKHLDRKSKRQRGETYVSRSGKEIPEKTYVDFSCDCRYKCDINLPKEERKKIFKNYWASGNWQAQTTFIVQSVKCTPVKRRFVSNSRIGTSREYFLNNIRVCKNVYLNCLGISNGRVNYSLQNKAKDGRASPDRRGCHISNKIPIRKTMLVKKFLDGIPKYKSHYALSDKQYFHPDLTVTKLYDLYSTSMKKNAEIPIGLRSFINIFKSYKVTMYIPKKDTRQKCDKINVLLKASEETEKENLEKELNIHL